MNQYDQYVSYAYNNKLINDTQRIEMQSAMNWCKQLTALKIPFLPRNVCTRVIQMVSDWNPNFNEYDIRKKCEEGQSLCYNFDSIQT